MMFFLFLGGGGWGGGGLSCSHFQDDQLNKILKAVNTVP